MRSRLTLVRRRRTRSASPRWRAQLADEDPRTVVPGPGAGRRGGLGGFGAVVARRRRGEAGVLGCHLEGPFISPQALGAQPPFALAPDLVLLDALAALAPIKVATIAPEIDPDYALLRRLNAHGVRVQLGHSRASCAAAEAALAAGAAGFTHLFNAMTGLHHRAPGMVGAALARAAEVVRRAPRPRGALGEPPERHAVRARTVSSRAESKARIARR